MTTEAESARDESDRAIEEYGELVTWQRIVTASPLVVASVDCHSVVRGYQPQDLAGGVVQGDSTVTLSVTDASKMQWPGVLPPGDQRVPLSGDRLLIQGRQRNVKSSAPIYVAGTLVRLELQVRGV